jgi:hypothetical protein
VDLRVSDLLAGASAIVRRKLRRAETAGATLSDDRHRIEEAVVRLMRFDRSIDPMSTVA